ncbi:MAG: helix-turn-helix domain-containing protein [Gemmatimonadota bacterium]
MARLALFQPDARSGARLSSALGGVHDLVACESWDGLLDVLSSGDVEGCLLDADHPSVEEAIPRIERLRDAYPDIALIGFTERDTPLEYYRLGTAGLEGFVAGTAGAMTTRGAVDEALALRRGRIVARALEGYLDPPAPAAVGWAVSHGTSDVTVEELAGAVDLSIDTLRDTLRSRDLPPPAALILWGRLVAAAARLQYDRRGVEETAFALGYASAPSLARASRTHTRSTPRELAKRGPERVLEELVAQVTGARFRGDLGPAVASGEHQPPGEPTHE